MARQNTNKPTPDGIQLSSFECNYNYNFIQILFSYGIWCALYVWNGCVGGCLKWKCFVAQPGSVYGRVCLSAYPSIHQPIAIPNALICLFTPIQTWQMKMKSFSFSTLIPLIDLIYNGNIRWRFQYLFLHIVLCGCFALRGHHVFPGCKICFDSGFFSFFSRVFFSKLFAEVI